MQTRKKSHFAGNTVPVNGESGGILYTRYTDPGELLLDGEKPVNDAPVEKKERKRKVKEAPEPAAAAPAPAAAAAPATVATAAPTLNFGGTEAPPDAVPVAGDDGSGEQSKVRKKARWTDEQKAAAKEEKAAARKAAGLPEKPTAAEKKKKKDKQKEEPLVIRKLAPEERISGPGNAEEATKIRETLGFIPPPTSAAAAPVAAAGGGGGFAFGFQAEANANDIKSEDSSSDEEEDEKKPMAAPPAAAAAVPAAVKEEEDDDSSSSSSSSDEEDEKLPKKEEEESSDDDTSSSSSDSDSSSSDDDEAPKPAATTVAAPATNANGALVSPLDSEFVPRRVYVGGMPYTFSEGQVAEFWEYCGAIESLDLLTFPDTGRFRGIAFITFATEEGYTAALGCDGEACEGQTVKVQKCKWSAKDRRAALMGQQGGDGGGQTEAAQGGGGGGGMNAAAVPPPPSYAGAAGVQDNAPGGVNYIAPPTLRPPAPKTTGYDVAYVGNIAYEADEAAVRALFEPFGVTKVRLHTDKDTGKPKGFAHVHFKDEPSLDSAMSLNGTQLMGRRIKVGYAQPKKEAPPAT